MTRVSPTFALGALALALLSVAGCRSGDDASASGGALRVVNGITDSTSLTATVPGATTGPSEVKADSASPVVALPANARSVQIQPNRGSGFAVNGVTNRAGTLSTAVAYGVLANGTQGGFVVTAPQAAPAAGQVAVQPVFGAYTAAGNGGTGTVYGFSFAPINGSGSSGGPAITFGQSAAPVTLPAGAYRVSIYGAPYCPPNALCAANVQNVFDSGGKTGVTLPPAAGANVLQLVAVDATDAQRSQYGSGVVLLLLDGAGGVLPIYNGAN